MIVYVVTESHEWEFKGVFSTVTKAEEYIATLMWPNCYSIKTVEVDGDILEEE